MWLLPLLRLRENGFAVEVVAAPDFAEVGRKAGVPADREGCHTVFIGDYVVSGHVPIEVVPQAAGRGPRNCGLDATGDAGGLTGDARPQDRGVHDLRLYPAREAANHLRDALTAT